MSARLGGTLEADEVLEILADEILDGFGDTVVVALSESLLAAAAGHEGVTSTSFPVAHVGHRDPAVRARLRERLQGTMLAPDRDAPASDVRAALGDDTKVLTLPLASRGRMLGALIVTEPVEDELGRRLLIDLAGRAGTALDNATLFGAERRLGLVLQRALLPAELAQPAGMAVAARYLAGTRGREVGGDFYLAHALDDGRVVLAIGDVMGHGAQSAARMGQLRAVLTAYAVGGAAPDRVLSRLAARADDLLDLPMATALVAVYDPGERRLTYASAGHPPGLVLAPGRPAAYLPLEPGPPLGTGPARHEPFEAELPEGGSLVLFTDGLVERRGRAIDAGMQALRQSVDGRTIEPDALCDHMLAAMGLVDGGDDDVALLVARH